MKYIMAHFHLCKLSCQSDATFLFLSYDLRSCSQQHLHMLWDEDASLPLTANVWGTKNTLSLTQDGVLKFRSDVKDTLFCHFIDYLSYHSGIVYGSRSGCMGSGCNSCQELLYITWVSFRGHHWLPWSLLKLSVLAGNEARPHLDVLGAFVE